MAGPRRPSSTWIWSRRGRELFFESLDNRIMLAGYTVRGNSFVADKPRLWSEKALANKVITRKKRRSRTRWQAHRGGDAG